MTALKYVCVGVYSSEFTVAMLSIHLIWTTEMCDMSECFMKENLRGMSLLHTSICAQQLLIGCNLWSMFFDNYRWLLFISRYKSLAVKSSLIHRDLKVAAHLASCALPVSTCWWQKKTSMVSGLQMEAVFNRHPFFTDATHTVLFYSRRFHKK